MKTRMKFKEKGNQLYLHYSEEAKKGDIPPKFINKVYTYATKQLLLHGFNEIEIRRFMGEQVYREIAPKVEELNSDEMEHTLNEYISSLLDDMDMETVEKITDNPQIAEEMVNFQNKIDSLLNDDETTKQQKNKKETNKQMINTPHNKIHNLLLEFKEGNLSRGQKEERLSNLVELLETEEKMFTVEFPDEKQPDGYKSRYYYINPKTKTYERNTKTRLKEIFNTKYHVKLHKNKQFYYNILERIYTSKTEQKHIIELENVYIDKRNFEIIPKTDDNIKFTADRLSYTTYDTHELRLFHYYDDVTLDDVLNGNKKMSFPMERIKEVFVPKTQPEETTKLRMFMQYMGFMIMGRNPAKLTLILYDLEDENTGNKGRSTLFNTLKLCFKDTFLGIDRDVLKDQFKIETYNRGKHGVFFDEMDRDILIKYNTVIKGLLNGSGNSGGAMYTREQIHIESLPLLIGSNGIPETPHNDSALLSRLMLIELPNKFVDSKEVREDTNTYPKITNLDSMMEQHIEDLSQVISIAINEFKQLDLTQSLDHQFAITPDIHRTMIELSKENFIPFLIEHYTEKEARGTNPEEDWITTEDIQNRICEAYKKAKGIELDKTQLTLQDIGYHIKRIYPTFITKKDNKKIVNNRTRYNLTLKTHKELENQTNEIIKTKPLHMKLFNSLQNRVYYHIKDGINTEQKLMEILSEEDTNNLNETLKDLYDMDLIEYTSTKDFV